MIKLKKGMKVTVTEKFIERGIVKGQIGIVENVTDKHAYITFNNATLTRWNEKDINRYLYVKMSDVHLVK